MAKPLMLRTRKEYLDVFDQIAKSQKHCRQFVLVL